MKILETMSNKPAPDKARAVILDNERNVLVSDYDGSLMFPGGKLDDGEDSYTAVVREVGEEAGIQLVDGQKLFTFQLTAKNYPMRDGTIMPEKLVEIDYFFFRVPNIELGSRRLTEKEELGRLTMRVVNLDELESFIDSHQTDNERWPYFKAEMLIVTKKLVEMEIER